MAATVSGSGPAVVLLHGQPGRGSDWESVVPLLAPRFTVIVPDRLGYGRTGGRAAGFAANAEATCELLDRLGRRSAIVAGHSWGGGVGLALAEAFPDRVAGLVLVASVAPGEAPSRLDRALARPVVGSAVAAVAQGSARLALGWRPLRAIFERRLPAHVSRMLGTSWRQEGVTGSFAVEQRALVDELDGLGPGMASLRAPTVVVSGTADRVVPPSAGRRLVAGIAGATQVLVDGAGHLLPAAHPGAVASAVVEVARRAGSG